MSMLAMATTNCIRPSPLNLVRCSAGPDPPARRSADYKPNYWDYGYIQSLGRGSHDHDQVDLSSFDQLKGHVRHSLLREDNPLAKLRVIDSVERLGMAYQFEEEINDMLYSISMINGVPVMSQTDGVLYKTLLFRLLRQRGFQTSQELLTFLADSNGSLNTSLCQTDIHGLLALYEASHLAFEGENILDEARVFSVKSLSDLSASIQPHLRSSVAHSLAIPLHWRAPRLEARWFIDHYVGRSEADPLTHHFAKLDFNIVQNMHQQELARITCWWRNIALNEKLPFARDRLMECFYFACGVAWEPCFRAAREVITKLFALIVVLDDIYDIYGTLGELITFTDAIGRWEAASGEELPEYMKPIYNTILDTSNEMADHVQEECGCDARLLFQKTWHDLCKAFLLEAKWHHGSHNPSFQEYLDNGWLSVSGPLMLLHAFPMLKTDITPYSLQKLESYPKLVEMVSKIFRLCNDSATHSEELKRGDAPSSIAIYMLENNATEDSSRQALRDITMDIWKMINQEAFNNCQYSQCFANACINMARISHCIYQRGDGLGAPDVKKKMEIKELFLEPFIV